MEDKRALTEEEKKKREAKLRERELRHKNKPPSRKLDTIDFLDRTHELFGVGGKYIIVWKLRLSFVLVSRLLTVSDHSCPP